MSDTLTESATLESTKINLETSIIHWAELQRFFASGRLIFVSTELDLVEAALHIAQDDKAQVEAWLQQQKIGQVSDEQAKMWLAANATLWAVVIKPWVLVQENLPTDNSQLH